MLARTFNHSMHKKIFFLFSFFILLQCKNAQEIENHDRDTYIEEIKNEMWDIVQKYGISNLPVPDYKLYYNLTKDFFGYKMVGFLYLEDGFILDISGFEVDQQPGPVIKSHLPNSVGISAEINMLNLAIFQDFQIDFENQSSDQDKANGSIVIKPESFSFEFTILQKYPHLGMESDVHAVKTHTPYFEFNPDNALTRRVRKKFRKDGFLTDLCSEWENILKGFLKEAVARCKFPDVKFKIRK